MPISKSLASLLIEFCYILDYLGDVDAPNEPTLCLLQNVQNILGIAPITRIGGHTQDVAQYNASNPETLTNIFTPGNLESVSTLAAYAIYNRSRLSKIVVLNLAFSNGISSERLIQAIDLSGVLGRRLSATRLTGTSSASIRVEDTMWGGQTYATGKADGTRVTEKSYNGQVLIAASEGIITQAM